MPGKTGMAFDRRQVTRAAPFVRRFVGIVHTEGKGRIMIEKEGMDSSLDEATGSPVG
jgi:hypothetical protein